MKELTALQEIGLTEGQSKVYLALLSLGPSTTGSIIKKARVSRSKVYEMLDALIQRGLVSFVDKGKAKYYEATDLESVIEYVHEKQEELSEQEEQLKAVLPLLKERRKQAHSSPTATVYEGKEGIKEIFADIVRTLKAGDEYYAIGVEPELFSDEHLMSFISQHHLRRSEKGIKVKLLVSSKVHRKIELLLKKSKKYQVRCTRQAVPTATLIYGDCVATFVWEKTPVGVVTRSEIIADRYKKLFDEFWQKASKA